MRRLPIYFLVDVSESMVGNPIKQVEEGMRSIIQELRQDPYALETVFVSVIAFAGKAKSLAPLTELYKFYPVDFPIGGGTSLGKALEFLMADMDRSLVKNTMEQKGDWKPIIFLFTDGNPTDDASSAIERWNRNYRRSANMVAVSLGDNVNTQLLGRLTENVLQLSKTDASSFKAFFKWVTASIKTSSVSVSDHASDELKLPSTTGINLEKVDTNKPCFVDENYVVVLGKCSTTKKPYLIKYAKRIQELEGLEGFSGTDFKLVGASPIEEESYKELSDGRSNNNINTNSLVGAPTCPCCGNQLGFVVCECGGVFCAGESPHTHCPWCGADGTLSGIGEAGLDVNRSRG